MPDRADNKERNVDRAAQYEYARTHLAIDAHAMVTIANTLGDIVYVNGRCCEVSGYKPEELLGRNHRIFKSDSVPAATFRDLWKTISQGQTWQGVLCNRRKDGSLYWVDCTIVPFLDTSGRPYQYLAIRTDISEQKRIERALRRQHEMQRICSEAAAELLHCNTRAALLTALQATLARGSAFLGADHALLLQHVSNSAMSVPLASSPSHPYSDASRQIWRTIHGHLQECQTFPNVRAQCLELQTVPLPRDASSRQESLLVSHCHSTARSSIILAFQRPDEHWPEESGELIEFVSRIACNALNTADINEDLLARESDLEATLNTTGDAILAVDNDARIRFANPNFAQLFNLDMRELGRGMPGFPLLPRLVQCFADEHYTSERLTETFQSRDGLDEEVELKDGRHFDMRSYPLTKHDQFIGRVWMLHDVSARRQALQTANAHQERLARAQRYANMATWEWNLNNNSIYWTDGLPPLLGLNEGALPHEPSAFMQRVHRADRQRLIRRIRESTASERPFRVEHRVIWPDGNVRWLLQEGRMARDGATVSLLGVVQDITDRIQAQAEERAARIEAEQANKAKSEFLSHVSHELRTPMNAILGFGQLLEMSNELPSQHADNVQEILKAGYHLLDLINEMLDLTRIEAGKLDLQRIHCDLTRLLDDAIHLIHPLAEQRDISLIAPKTLGPAGVMADPKRLKQVLLNLLSNAVKYNRTGGRVEIDLSVNQAARSARLTIADTGLGLTAEQLTTLFEPFTQFGSTRDQSGGTGIGLTISRHIMELLGGSLDVESTPGAGSRFWIELPLSRD